MMTWNNRCSSCVLCTYALDTNGWNERMIDRFVSLLVCCVRFPPKKVLFPKRKNKSNTTQTEELDLRARIRLRAT